MGPEVVDAVGGALPVGLVVFLTWVSPYITAYFTRPSMDPKFKQVISLLVAALIAVVYVLFEGQIHSWETFFVAVPTIFGVQQAIYGLLLKESAKKVEATKGNTDPVVAVADVAVEAEVGADGGAAETPAKG